jgi:hypothetical protein
MALQDIVIQTSATDASNTSSLLSDHLAVPKAEMTRFREEQQQAPRGLKQIIEVLWPSAVSPETKLGLTDEQQRWGPNGHAEIHLSRPIKIKFTCRSTCRCSCHRTKSVKAHPIASHLLGSLFAKYTAFPRYRSKCSVAHCTRQATNVRVVYFFPFWLLHCALYLTYTHLSAGPTFSLTVRRVVPINSNINYYVAAGLIDEVYGAFSAYISTPNDIHGVSGETPLHVSSASGTLNDC